MNLFKSSVKNEPPAPPTKLDTTISKLHDLKSACEQYMTRLSILEAEAERHAATFDLSKPACAAHAETANGLAHAKTLEPLLRRNIRAALDEAGRERSASDDRIRRAHGEIDVAIKQSIIRSLPETLGAIEVTAEHESTVRGNAFTNAVGGGAVGNRLSIWATAPGQAEASARLSPAGLYFGALAPNGALSDAQKVLNNATAVLDRLAAEEIRCQKVLASYQAVAA